MFVNENFPVMCFGDNTNSGCFHDKKRKFEIRIFSIQFDEKMKSITYECTGPLNMYDSYLNERLHFAFYMYASISL